MLETLQLEEAIERSGAHETPTLLVEWSPRWREFVESIGPALSRSEARLAGEAPFGLLPLRIMIPSYVVEAVVILAFIFLEAKIAQLRPYAVPQIASHDVIYYSGDELPRVQDLGGAEAGTSGTAGGDEAFHRTQTIKIARGGSLVPKVVDAPNLKLPASHDAVANLLAIKPDPGPPPAEGLRSQRSVPNLATSIVAPSPNVIRDYTRNGIQMDSVIAPSPNVTRDRPLTAPSLNAELIPPAPMVSSDHKLVAPALAPTVVPPAPNVARERGLTAPSLNANVVAPSPTVPRDPFRSNSGLAANVIPPSPQSVSRQISSSPVQMMDAHVVPPPVSAPERAGARNSQVTLPTPSVVAPPPSADINSDTRRLAGANLGDSARSVVPPPPQQSGLVSSLIGKIFGTQEVVPPPPSVNARSANSGSTPSLAANVVPPAPSMNSGASGGNPSGNRRGLGSSLGSNVVAPPPSVGVANGSGTRQGSGSAPYLGNPSVVPPPPSLGGPGGGTGKTGGAAGTNGGTLLAANVVPPPPSVSSGSSASGSGTARKGMGLGSPLDAGSNISPPNAAGSGKDAGAIVSNQPGSKVGLPPALANGSLAMSPAGGEKTGLGGAGGGSGIGRGSGNGSTLNGTGSGAGKNGTARGADPNANGGISPTTGPGGAGNATSGTPAIRGVDISGGSGIVTLPSFGSDGSNGSPDPAGRSNLREHQQTLGVTIVATANSGGAFEPYKKLLHGTIYTTYIDTSLGNVVMEFADQRATDHTFASSLTAPAALRSDLPEGLPRARMVLSCTVDASGNLTNLRVLEPGPATMTAKVVTALRSWKFQPAMKNNQPEEVNAILGFGIDTNDRF